MTYLLIFTIAYLVIGVVLAIFANPIAKWDYSYDLRWNFMLMFGLRFRIWFLRIAGIIMICMAGASLLVLLPQLSP